MSSAELTDLLQIILLTVTTVAVMVTAVAASAPSVTNEHSRSVERVTIRTGPSKVRPLTVTVSPSLRPISAPSSAAKLIRGGPA